MTPLDDTIVALASAPGPGARAIVRLSGPDARRVVGTVFDPMPTGRAMAQGSLRLPGLHSPLPAMVYSMPGPQSYTGQDCVEVHTISSPPLVDLLVGILLDAGAPAAIVSPVPGTTRDYVTRSVTLQGTNVELIDTAGRQAATNAIEEQAQRLGREQAARADLVLWCVPADEWRAERSEPPGSDP